MGAVGLINTCFILITHQYVEWGGTFFNSFVIYLICYVVYYEIIKRKAEEERTEALTQLMDYKQQMMLAQFKPHFLFNSLNILYSMEGNADVDDTRHFILSLSQIYRYILDNQNKKEIALESELRFVEHYIYILSLRYDSKLKINFIGTPPPNVSVIPFSLQLLIENVVKHNRLTSASPMEVEIMFMQKGIRISNPINENTRKYAKHGGPHSLEILKNIFQSYNKELIISNNGTVFSVEVPYIEIDRKWNTL
ncbi:MAG: histidine kinase [Muribaculaceae bacterium]|nr:histidine kinase [Muribaculaceae bacterium]